MYFNPYYITMLLKVFSLLSFSYLFLIYWGFLSKGKLTFRRKLYVTSGTLSCLLIVIYQLNSFNSEISWLHHIFEFFLFVHMLFLVFKLKDEANRYSKSNTYNIVSNENK